MDELQHKLSLMSLQEVMAYEAAARIAWWIFNVAGVMAAFSGLMVTSVMFSVALYCVMGFLGTIACNIDLSMLLIRQRKNVLLEKDK